MNLQDIWQAAYTAGVVLPKPVASCRYYHRSLNPKKLIDVGFSALAVSRRHGVRGVYIECGGGVTILSVSEQGAMAMYC